MSNKFDIIIPPQDIACEPGLQEKLANGDHVAFAWVYKNYYKKVYDYAMLVTGNEEQSEDIVQDVFVKLWQNREKIREVENFNGYMYMLYRNHVTDAMKNQKKERNVRIVYCDGLPVTANAVEVFIDYKETRRLIQDAVRQLPQGRRQIFEMTQHGMNSKDISRTLGRSRRTVWNQLQKAGKFLNKRLGR